MIVNHKSTEFKSFMIQRLEIQRLLYLSLCFIYIIAFLALHPADTPPLSVVLTIVASPVLVFCFYLRACSLLFVRNWFYITYLVVSTAVFIYVMSLFSEYDYDHKYGSYEFVHLFYTTVFGFCSAMLVSFPFKLTQTILFDTELYISSDLLTQLEYEVFPDKKKKDIAKKEEKFKYDNLNETQLQVELKLAVNEDRFEDAEVIRKVLEKKFR